MSYNFNKRRDELNQEMANVRKQLQECEARRNVLVEQALRLEGALAIIGEVAAAAAAETGKSEGGDVAG